MIIVFILARFDPGEQHHQFAWLLQSSLVVLRAEVQSGALQVPDLHGGSWCCWSQLSFAIKTQLKAPKALLAGHFLPFIVSL